jgi:hypothetical protein
MMTMIMIEETGAVIWLEVAEEPSLGCWTQQHTTDAFSSSSSLARFLVLFGVQMQANLFRQTIYALHMDRWMGWRQEQTEL